MNLVPDEVTMDPLTITALLLASSVVSAGIAVAVARHLARNRAAAAIATAVSAERVRLATEHLKQVAETDAEVRAKAAETLNRQREALEVSLARDRAAVAQDRAAVTQDRAAATEERTAAQRTRAEAVVAEERARARETKLAERETALDRRHETVDQREARLRKQEEVQAQRIAELGERAARLEQGEQVIDTRLAEIATLTVDAAKEELLKRLDTGLAAEQSERIARNEKDLNLRSKELGVEIISRAIQRYAAEHTAETTSAKIKLADEEMKGRIIGKEGRNIKAFEQATGVDLLLDDQQPNIITISCFSGLRREMARRTLTVLLEDGRIHPGRIEEVMAKVQQDMDREVLKLGEDAAFAVEVSGLHPQLLRLLGKLQWRTSYGQNVLQHTQEVAFLCGAMAADFALRRGRWTGPRRGINPAGLLAWALGLATGLTPILGRALGSDRLARFQPASLAAFGVAFVAYALLSLVRLESKPEPVE